MKFLYEYRTSDNAKHSGVINSPNREAAYAALKAKGIKPCRFSEAPGILNKVLGKGKRWCVIAVLAVVIAVSWWLQRGVVQDARRTNDVFDSPTRRQLIGDSAVIEKGIKTGWANSFDLEGDRFLASYAIPGVEPCVKTTTETEMLRALSTLAHGDGTVEMRQIVAIVEGMKKELRSFLEAGGTVKGYGARLVERQQQECGYYERVRTEIETAAQSGMNREELETLWETRNDALRKMGIKLVQMPE